MSGVAEDPPGSVTKEDTIQCVSATNERANAATSSSKTLLAETSATEKSNIVQPIAPSFEEKKSKKSRKRSQSHQSRKNRLEKLYQGMAFHRIPSTGRPGTPHRYFAESFRITQTNSDDPSPRVTENNDQLGGETRPSSIGRCNDDLTGGVSERTAMLHQHANGLVIVTVGDLLLAQKESIAAVEFHVQPSESAQSANAKRKQQSDILQGKSKPETSVGVVQPSTALCTIRFGVQAGSDPAKNCDTSNSNNNNHDQEDPEASTDHSTSKVASSASTSMTIFAGVWGTLLEIHNTVTEKQLLEDPLGSGYLAVILPAGSFPPQLSEDAAAMETRP